MANWGSLGTRGNVQDRRGLAGAAVGGLSLTGVVVYAVFRLLTGGDVADVLGDISQIPIQQQPGVESEQFAGEDSYEVFASTVLGSNNEMWNGIFNRLGREYTEPTLVLFRNSTQSACGGADSRVGPHYCPADQTIYLDETFFDELTRRFGAEGGDVAEAYVIAHEVAHHAQHELGVFNRLSNFSGPDNETSVRLELQADCFAGLWAHSIKGSGVLEPGEIREAMDAAAAVGDDRIQEKVTGQVNPESWTHGSSDQRVNWFTKGYESGNLNACNTFE